ncbi:MAG: hypothetical protein RL226_91 [Bacteroidota bacterium]|jgi:hypothetical protein
MKRFLFLFTLVALGCGEEPWPSPEQLLNENSKHATFTSASNHRGIGGAEFVQRTIGNGVDVILLENGWAVIEEESMEDLPDLTAAKWRSEEADLVIDLKGREVRLTSSLLVTGDTLEEVQISGYKWVSSTAPGLLDSLSFYEKESISSALGRGLNKLK